MGGISPLETTKAVKADAASSRRTGGQEGDLIKTLFEGAPVLFPAFDRHNRAAVDSHGVRRALKKGAAGSIRG
jgi:hypothetical protein